MRFKSLKLVLLCIALVGALSVKANPVSNLIQGATNPDNYFIFGQINNFYQLSDQLASKRLELELARERLLGEQNQRDTLEAERARTQTEIDTLESTIDALRQQDELSDADNQLLTVTLPEQLSERQANLVSLETQLTALNANLNDTSGIDTLESEIQTLRQELDKSQLRLRSYAETLVRKLMLATVIWVFAMITKWIISKIFKRLNFGLTPVRKAFILQLIRLAINSIAVVAILLVFFSQLLQALPYFAIFATALAFAMRDVLLSVIAWIIIGTKDGYKVGHYLHIGTLWGTVVEINPFNTIVRQGGMSGQTGRLLTFPNKKIFEEFLENWSKLYNFTFLKWDFFLEQGSDVERAEEILLQILADEQAKFADQIKTRKHLFLKKGLNEIDLEPHIFWEVQANGILLRGKLLVNFDNFFEIRSAVTRAFAIAINQEKNIQLRFVNNLIPNQL